MRRVFVHGGRARRQVSNKDQSITIQSSGGLSKADIEQMVRDAEKFAVEDQKRKEVIEAANFAESTIHDAEKNMREYKDQLDPAEAKKVEELVASVRKTIEQQASAEAIRKESGELQRAALKLFELVYKKMQASKGAEAASGPSNDDIKDADFKEKK